MIKRKLSALLLPILVATSLLLGVIVLEARSSNSLAICNVPTGSYPTIQSAVDDSICGVIDVGNGNFIENVAISRTVTVAGQGEAKTIIDGNVSGSVFRIEGSGAVTLTGVTITNGLAIEGGGIHNTNGTVNLDTSTISGNSASHRGGGIFNSGILKLTNSIVNGNDASHGGGIRNPDGTITITNSTISNNTATTMGGAGIDNDSLLTIIDSTISDNTAAREGGGMYTFGEVIIINSTFSGNIANSGGGVNNGGGGTLNLNNSTISGNTANSGGGILSSSGSVTLSNTIVANNNVADCSGDIISTGYNLDSDSSCELDALGDLTNDPRLGPLQQNGGDTLTHALQDSSPAIDAGNCPGSNADQRGFSRPVDILSVDNVGDACDIGAFEVHDESISGLAAINNGPTEVGGQTTLTATTTAGTNVTYAWDFGDAEMGSGPVVTHTYLAAGMYTAVVTATNSVSTDTTTTMVTITEVDFLVYIPFVVKD